MEALVRLDDPQKGILCPNAFLPLADIDSRVAAIDAWVLRRACRDAVSFRRAMGWPVRMNVNISAAFLESADCAASIVVALSAAGLPPQLLQLEVTEQVLIRNIEIAARALNRVRELGVTVAIDDFGTGYNTFTSLKFFPADCLKIDGAFVRDIESSRYSREICSCMIDLGNKLGLSVIGECVESEAQASFLRQAGSSELQGFYLGRPAPLEDLLTTYATCEVA